MQFLDQTSVGWPGFEAGRIVAEGELENVHVTLLVGVVLEP